MEEQPEPYENTKPLWIYIENAFPEELCKQAFERCVEQTINLPQKKVVVYGKSHLEPRLSQLYSIKEGHVYTYAKLKQVSRKFSDVPELDLLKEKVKEHMRNLNIPVQEYDTALVNHYRAGTSDKVGPHPDKDGIDFVIASISLGRAAKFIIHKRAQDGGREKVEEILLKPNSLLFMLPGMQENYLHEIRPFTKKELKEHPEWSRARINITMRKQL